MGVIKGRWEMGEERIAENSWCSVCYAMNVLGGRFKKGEKEISSRPEESYQYAFHIIGGRWRSGERELVRSACTYDRWENFSDYIKDCCGGTAPEEIEDEIMTSTAYMFNYAKKCLKGRLPDRMHAKMVMLSFSDQADHWVKKYCSTKKFMIERKTRRKKAS